MLPSLALLTSARDPLAEMETVIQRLRQSSKESRYLEWKQHPPTGPSVSTRSKYRGVKAAISFANTDGGFLIYGITPAGDWVGLSKVELEAVDPAHVTELVNGCISPEIPQLTYVEFQHDERLFAVLHGPPSQLAPHVTTKCVQEKDADGKVKVILDKHVVYARQGAKVDLATPIQHQQMVNRRAELVRDELVRRVKEVAIPSIRASESSTAEPVGTSTVTVDPEAPAVRLTRQPGASGVLLHEELSEGLFEEINNVVDANRLLANDRAAFVLGEPIYYRIYAERQHVEQDEKNLSLLAWTGLHDYYAANLYWALRLPPVVMAKLIRAVSADPKNPQVHGLIRLLFLLGDDAREWWWEGLQRRWHSHPQPPDWYWTFSDMRKQKTDDPRLVALRVTGKTLLRLPGLDAPAPIETLLDKPIDAARLLSESCLEVFRGSKDFRHAARYLDVIAYGLDIRAAAEPIIRMLTSDAA